NISITSPTGNTRFVVAVDTANTLIEANETNNITLATNVTAIAAQLTLQLPYSQLLEGTSMSGIVSRNGDTSSPLQVTLAKDNPGEISFSLTQTTSVAVVTIPAGSSSAQFPVRAVNDGVVDGPKLVNISATASNFASAMATVTVLDAQTPSLTVVVTNSAVF